jgi:dGTPase
VHSASLRRLAAKTQVVGPQSDDFVRNRLTHSLEVAQVARDISRALNGGQPELADLAETAALAHDLGHPPFGHNGEDVLAEIAVDAGGFEGNAQTLRILTRLEAKTFDVAGSSVGLNLTRATLDACTKYPWERGARPGPKFGAYADDLPVFGWLRDGAPDQQRCVEAQIMDLADDVAYSVHDVEDGVVAGRIDLSRIDVAAVGAAVRAGYRPDLGDDDVATTLTGLRAVGSWPTRPHDGTRRGLAALKNLTSDLIGRFCGAVQEATFSAAEGPFTRYRAELIVPEQAHREMAVLKGIAAHYVMQTDDRLRLMARQRELLAELVAVLCDRGPDALDPQHREDWWAAADDAARLRVVLD